ncbi:MAG: NUDIX hydrolase, partial [Burkholderiaceae bacterium]|nr:NUDIX hydrolase [Burkholderiaceae bacterium]
AIPWEEIAFPTVSHTLKFFFADRENVRRGGSYALHTHDIFTPLRRPE